MTGILCLDTSAFLRLFLNEPQSNAIHQIVLETEEIFALRLVLTEARVSLDRLWRHGQLESDDFTCTKRAVELFWETQIQVLELTEEAYLAAEWAASMRPGLRTLDALHLGGAHVLRKEVRPTPVAFLSCDHRQLAAAEDLKFPTPFRLPR